MTLDLQTILLARADEQVRSLRGRGALGEDEPAPIPARRTRRPRRLCDRCKARQLNMGNRSGVCTSCRDYRRVCVRCQTERIHNNNRSGICWTCFERGER